MLHAEQMLPMHEHAPQTPNEPYTTNSLRSGGGTGGMGETRGGSSWWDTASVVDTS